MGTSEAMTFFYKITLPNKVVLRCKTGAELDLTLAKHPSVRLFQPQQIKIEVVNV